MDPMHFFLGLAALGIIALIWEIVTETIEEDETTMSQMRSRSKED
jgi:hypothetical protein